MNIEKTIDSFINLNNGCEYDDLTFTPQQIKKRYLYILKKIQVIDTGTIVALKLKDKLNYFLAILACMRANITYVPLGIHWPSEYIKKIKKKSNFKIIIDDNFFEKTKIKKKKIFKNHLLYLMFTSGSTGEPKGCAIPKSAYLNFLKWVKNSFPGIKKSQKIILNTNFTFDVSLMEIAILILNKNRFILNTNDSPFHLFQNIAKENINILCLVPNSLDLLLNFTKNDDLSFKNLKYLFVAGSQFYSSLYNKIKKKASLANCKIYNCYGPTEATIYCSFKKVNLKNELIVNNNISIGKQIKGNILKIKDLKNDNFITKDKVGELYISGKQTMIGYENSKDNGLIKIRNKKYYPSGDLTKKINGNLYILGRIDDTIKTSGHRINLSTLDNVLQKNKIILHSKTLSIKDKLRDNIIVTFIVGKDKKFTEKELLSLSYKYLKKKLPKYYLPHKIIIIKEFPVGLSGKIDKKKLLKSIY